MAEGVATEADHLRHAMEDLGYQYVGGGPYPFAPRMRFRRGREFVAVTVQSIAAPPDEERS